MPAMYELLRRSQQLLEEVDTSAGDALHNETTLRELARSKIGEWASESHMLEATQPFALVRGKVRLDFPEDFLLAKWVDDHSLKNYLRVRYRPMDIFKELIKYTAPGQVFYFSRWTKDLILYPPPSDNSVQTTLSADLDITDTDMSLTSGVGFRDAETYVGIGNEIILCRNLTGNNLSIHRRGVNGTRTPTPGTPHSAGATVTELNLHLLYYRNGEFSDRRDYITGNASFTLNSNIVTGAGGTLWATNVFPGDFIGVGDTSDPDLGPIRFYEILRVETDTKVVLAQPFKEPTKATSSYAISPPIFRDQPRAGQYMNAVAHGVAAQAALGIKAMEIYGALEAKWQEMLQNARADKHIEQEATARYSGDEEEYLDEEREYW